MAKWHKIAAAAIAAVAIILLAYAILSERAEDDMSAPGMGDRHVYSSTGLVIIVVSSFLIAIALMFILLREEYEPLPSSMTRTSPPPPPEEGVKADVPARDTVNATPTAEERARETYLVLRLLSGDERTMYKAIVDAGGEALQKDLIKTTRMSNAKVSRVLDRLDEKGVITKERHGSTNLVRISLDGD